MFSPEERQRAVDLYFATPMTAAQVVEHLGYPTRQCLERWLAKDPGYAGHMAKPIIPLETRAKAIEPVPGGMRGSGPPNRSARASERSATGSRRIARAAWPRCGPKTGTPARPTSQRCDGIETPATPRPRAAGSRSRNRGNALMREVVEVAEKRPGRRPAAPVEQGEDAADRPSAPDVFARPDDMLARHRTGRPPTATTPGSPLTDSRAQDGGGRGVRRVQGQVRVPQDQGHAPNPRLGEGDPQNHGRGRSDGACSRTTRVRLIRGRDHARARQPRRPRLHGWDAEREMAHGHHPGSRPGTGRRASHRRSTATTAGSSRTRPVPVPTPGSSTGCSSRPRRRCRGGVKSLVRSDCGCRCRWPGWPGLMGRYGPARSTGAKGRSPDAAAAEGVPRTHEDGIRLSRALGGAYP